MNQILHFRGYSQVAKIPGKCMSSNVMHEFRFQSGGHFAQQLIQRRSDVVSI